MCVFLPFLNEILLFCIIYPITLGTQKLEGEEEGGLYQVILMMVMREEDRKEEQHFDGNDDLIKTALSTHTKLYNCLGLTTIKLLSFLKID